jgi:hypothetical protein
MVEQVKFESAVVSKPFFQAFLKEARQFSDGLVNVKVCRLVEGYDVTMNTAKEKDVLVVKARAKGRGYFVRFHPLFVTTFKQEQNAN